MHKHNFIKIHSLFLKILRKNEVITSSWAITLLKSSGKFHVLVIIHVLCVSHNTACTKCHQNGIVLTYILSVSMHLQNFIKIHQLVHTILSINEISTSVKGHNSVENERKILFNHPNLQYQCIYKI